MGRKKKEEKENNVIEFIPRDRQIELQLQLKGALRILARARDDFQKTRIKLDNRLGRKADGSKQKVLTHIRQKEDDMITAVADVMHAQEKIIEQNLLEILEEMQIYTKYLKNVKGVGAITAAWIISDFDIYKAAMPSQMFQYAGFNPGMVRGIKRIKKEEYREHMGDIIKFVEKKDLKTNIVETEYFIDKKTQYVKFISYTLSPISTVLS
jgi:hypothetical protein